MSNRSRRGCATRDLHRRAIATAAAACLPGGTFAHLYRRPQGPIYVVLAIDRPGAAVPCHRRYRCDITLTFSYILLDIETKFSYI